MLIFAASDKGGTGRSVTSCNLAYQHALQGRDSCYLDFDFGSPTSGAIFEIPGVQAGVAGGGLHSYLTGGVPRARQIDVWADSHRDALRRRPGGAGKLTLMPGDSGFGEFSIDEDIIARCADLFLRADEEHDLVIVDLSAGRSYAIDMVLAATALDWTREVQVRWLIFHRWTRQHIIAANGLVYGPSGILESGQHRGHDREALRRAIRFVRTAVPDISGPDQAGLRAEQLAWLEVCDQRLQELAGRSNVGRAALLAKIPLDPVLQWQEQILSGEDVWLHRTANQGTVNAFEELAKLVTDDRAWDGL
ncbi:SCO2523 family variant P-loop protein [Dactylosporangium sp. NBC_01737]|uniref:SCO2523 family variant P-loop protein n=1 Tax=Dactylosporangium sp. NBC_01737 TaxID=2975959 RepID=UPI002E14C070|nr:SCO2523 family variant P-loop protein [Dactylosporangium sp. NBC_01737]